MPVQVNQAWAKVARETSEQLRRDLMDAMRRGYPEMSNAECQAAIERAIRVMANRWFFAQNARHMAGRFFFISLQARDSDS